MSGRVLASEQAIQAVGQMESIVNGGLSEQITALDNQGKILSDPDVWDGPRARQFRDEIWPQTRTALENAKQQLDELHRNVRTIANNIMLDGGMPG